ncbi:hypothetical protein Ddye_013949 [Dipteronia dyeriana]|uniref:Uncharacterized protein n=1 Tax=Dipteronia dyeriana TaxID=168575 RepID=A0AAD9X7C8_9ROSI|nr:hypothetical protein Ddye_013949 [Dipteronia dyeriana]
MDIDSFCESTPDQFPHNHGHQQQHDLLGQPPLLLDPELVCLKSSTSSDCWSAAASKAPSLDCGLAAVSETVSLTEERSRNHDHVQKIHNQASLSSSVFKLCSLFCVLCFLILRWLGFFCLLLPGFCPGLV